MKTKNRADRTGVVGASEKETRTSSPSFSKAGPPKLELQMGRKWVWLPKCDGLISMGIMPVCNVLK